MKEISKNIENLKLNFLDGKWIKIDEYAEILEYMYLIQRQKD